MVLKQCSRCLVFTTDGNRLSEARVVHTNDTATLYFNNHSLKETKFKCRVNFFDDQAGLIRTVCTLKIRKNPSYPQIEEPMMADCKINEVMGVVQRQKDVRVKVKIETAFFSPKYGTFYGTIENLSAGGLYLVTRQPLNANDVFSFKYSFKSLERRFEVRAIRAQKEAGSRYGYGCCFINLTDGADAAIRSYVYKMQRGEVGKN